MSKRAYGLDGLELLGLISNVKDSDIISTVESLAYNREIVSTIIEDYLDYGVIDDTEYNGKSLKGIMLKERCDLITAVHLLLDWLNQYSNTNYIKH